MKTKTLAFILSIIAGPLLAEVVVVTFNNVQIDGKAAGSVTAATLANPSRADEIQAAIQKRVGQYQATLKADLIAELRAAYQAGNSAALGAAITRAELPAKDAHNAAVDKKVAELLATKR